MTALEQGARVIEQAVRERAEAREVVVTRMSWNGDEGLKSRQSLQTLLASSTQSGGRASFTREQLREAAGGELPDTVRPVVDRLIEDLHTAASGGVAPRGGSGG